MKKGFSVLRDIFTLDLRSLALFRILFGLCLFFDVAYRIPYAYDFYSDSGVLPRDALITKFMSIWETSLFLISGQPFVATILLCTITVSALFLCIGFYTRTAALVCWILVVSMHTRNGVILHGGDDVFRVILFWIQFVPLSACYSVDSYLNKTKLTSYNHVSWGGAGLLIQFLSMYFFTGLLKIHPVWHTEGTGVYYALSLEQFSSRLGQALLPYFGITQLLSYATIVLEFLGPLLILSPIAFLRQRTLVVFAFIGFHLGLVLSMELGMFPWVCIAVWTFVFPSSVWDRLKFWKWSPIFKIAHILQSWKITAPPPMLQQGRILKAIAIIYIGLITTWNIYELDDLKLEKPIQLRWIMSITEMYQRWSMFAPYPRKDDGWYKIVATRFDGTEFDPFQKDHKINEEKPKDVAATYRNSMWRKYLTNTWLKNYYDYRLYFGRYLCRMWNTQQQDHDMKIDTIYIYYMLEMTPPPGSQVGEPREELLWRHYCYEKPENWEE